jgi:hypothetical protein
MNDFYEIESELKKLQPMQPPAELFARIEEALRDCREGAAPAERVRGQPKGSPYSWWSLGFGLAAAAVFLLLARISTDHAPNHGENVAQIPPATETRSAMSKAEGSTSDNQFIPANATEVVYNTLDEGLRFVNGSEAPMRRLRCQIHETLEWRNPHTGESLRVSYPSEEVILVPISGQ